MVGGGQLLRIDEIVRQRRSVAFEAAEEAIGVIAHLFFLARSVRHQHAARIGEAERRLEPGGDVVGEERDGAGGGDRGQQRIADAMLGDGGAEILVEPGHRLAGEIRRLVEEQEGAFLRGERAGREIGCALDRLQPLRREFHRRGTAIARAAEDERVGKAGDAETDTPLRLRLLRLVLEREARDVDGVVQHAHRQRHQPLEFGEIEAGLRREGVAHQRRQVDRAQEASAVRRKWLLSAIVDIKAIGIESVDAGDLDVKNRRHAICHNCRHRRGEALLVEAPTVAIDRRGEPCCLAFVLEADDFGKTGDILARDNQLMIGIAPIGLASPEAVRKLAPAGGPPLAINSRDDAKAQQHALYGRKSVEIALRQPYADALGLRAHDAAVGIEEPAQEMPAELGRCLLDLRRDLLVAGGEPELESECLERARREPIFATPRHLNPTLKVDAVRQAARSGFDAAHDAGNARPFHAAITDRAPWPDREHGLVAFQHAIADEQADEIALVGGSRPLPRRQGAVIVQDDVVAGPQIARFAPFMFEFPASRACGNADSVIGGKAEAQPVFRLEPQNRTLAGRKEAPRTRREGLAVDECNEGPADQAADLAWSIAGLYPGVAGHARVSGMYRLAIV